MSLLAVGSAKGAPGVTSTCLALAAAWPRPVVLAELDAAGGDVGLRCAGAEGALLAGDPSLLSLAAALRRGGHPSVWSHTQRIAGGLAVLTGPEGAEQSVGLAALWRPLAEFLAGVADGDVLADVGRLAPGGPGLQVAARADLVVLVARATPEGVWHLRQRVQALWPTVGGRLAVAVIAPPRQAPGAERQVREVLGHLGVPLEVIRAIADDPAGLARLQAGQRGRRLAASLLVRTARALAADLDARLTAARPAPTAVPRAPAERGTG